MSIVTKGGDGGETSLLGGKRVQKDDLRLECLGTLDELNTFVSFAASLSDDGLFLEELERIQDDLHLLTSNIALSPDAGEELKKIVPEFRDSRLQRIEETIKKLEGEIEPLRNFIFYGGHRFASALQVSRTITRRAERVLVKLGRSEQIKPAWLAYLNRLSDLFFLLSRAVNKHYGIKEKPWNKDI